MNKITTIHAREIADSRQKPTLEVTVEAGSFSGSFAMPSGASTGVWEACELRDHEGGMSLALEKIDTVIAPALIGMDVGGQAAVDVKMCELDGTEQKKNLGGNTILGVSLATARCAAIASGQELYTYLRTLETIPTSRKTPLLYLNYINGGKHAHSPIAFQEHMLVPRMDSVAEALLCAQKISGALEEILRTNYGEETARSMGDEGGYVMPAAGYTVPFELLVQAIAQAGFEGKVDIAIDVAATSFYDNGVYAVDGKAHDSHSMTSLYRRLIADFPILSIEDPFYEEAFADFAYLKKELPTKIVGDDLTVTNVKRLQMAIDAEAISALIIKPNQIGTLTETLATMKLARANNIDCIVSHRSGETMDDFVADLAFAFGAFGLKAGALRKPERKVKYDRLAVISRH
ncbi:phosphopyruvate hydratase [bacterium]|nr:phosphopyruvate hydratase [bacterium]